MLLPELLEEHFAKTNDLDDGDAESKASYYLVMLTLASSIPQLSLTGSAGSVADRYGRKVIMVLSIFSFLLNALVVTAVAFKPEVPLAWLVLGSF